jgi:hypothetical protein
MSLPFINFDVSPSSRTSNPTNYRQELCLACSSPFHNADDCPHWGQFTNFSCGQLNTNFSDQGFESHSNSYTPNQNNHFDFSWQAHATENYAPQVDELHHPDYPQFDNQFSSHPSYDYPPKQSSLEETLKEFMELVGHPTIPVSHELSLEETLEEFRKTVNQPCQEIIDATVANTEAVAWLEGHFGHLVAELNRIEEEELQSQEMAIGQYMIDEDCANDPHHEHVQATTTLVSEERADTQKEEQVEKFEPPQNSNPSNDKEVSIEAHSFVTIPLETYDSPQVLSSQCLEEPSYVAIFEDSHTHDHTSRYHDSKRNFRSKFLGYISWRNILLEGYQILKKQGWKGLVGHPYERGRHGFATFYFSYFIFLVIVFYFSIICLFVYCCFRLYIYCFCLYKFFGVVCFTLLVFSYSVTCDRAQLCTLDRMRGFAITCARAHRATPHTVHTARVRSSAPWCDRAHSI